MLCVSCRAWTILEGDAFCGYCASTTVRAMFVPSSFHVYRGADDPIRCRTILKNAGSVPLSDFQWAWDWAGVSCTEPDLAGVVLDPGCEMPLDVVVDTEALGGTVDSVIVTLRSSAGRVDCRIYVSDPPAVRMSFEGVVDDALECVSENPATPTILKGKLQLTNDSFLQINEIGTGYPWLRFVPDVELPLVLNVDRAEVGLRWHLDLAMVPGATEQHGFVCVRAERLEEQLFNFYVRRLRPARLSILFAGTGEASELAVQAFEGLEQRWSLRLKNIGDVTLEVTAITTAGPGVPLSGEMIFPWRLEPGESAELPFGVGGPGVPVGVHTAVMEVLSNDPASPYRLGIRTTIKSLPKLDEYLAIDFGTTSSCACFFNVDNVFEMIPIQDAMPRSAVPSVIQYQRFLSDGVAEYLVGEDARQRSFDPNYRLSIVTSVKRRLGSTRAHEVVPERQPDRPVELLPETIAAHIIGYILRRAEAHIRKRVTRVVATHPSKFEPFQIRALERAFKLNGVEQLYLVPEPEAAAVEFIVQSEGNQSYDLLVLDFGGGTADLTLLNVDDRIEPTGNRHISVKTVATDGNPRFGGDDVTWALAGLIARTCEAAMKPHLRGATIPFRSEDRGAYQTVDEQSKVTLNNLTLIKEAELIKIGLSSKPIMARTLRLYCVDRRGRFVSEEFSVSMSREDLDKWLVPEVEALVRRMKNMVAVTGREIRYLLLAGKSSNIVCVRETMERHFGAGKMVRPDDLKECVARGAMQWVHFVTNPGGVIIKASREERTANSIGILRRTSVGGRSEFLPVIPQRTRIPTGKFPVPGIVGLRPGVTFQVYENLGASNFVEEQPRDFVRLGTVTPEIPDEVPEKDLANARFFVEMLTDVDLRFIVKCGALEQEYPIQKVLDE